MMMRIRGSNPLGYTAKLQGGVGKHCRGIGLNTPVTRRG